MILKMWITCGAGDLKARILAVEFWHRNPFLIQTSKFVMKYNLLWFQISGRLINERFHSELFQKNSRFVDII